MIEQTTSFWDDWTAQDNWNQIMEDNYEANQATVDGFAKQMVDAWNHGLYFGAGQLMGLDAGILCQTPSFTTEHPDLATEFVEFIAETANNVIEQI